MGYRYNSEEIDTLISILGEAIKPVRKKLDSGESLTKDESKVFYLTMTLFDVVVNARELDVRPMDQMMYQGAEFDEQMAILAHRCMLFGRGSG